MHIVSLICLNLILIEKSTFQSWLFNIFCHLIHFDIRSVHLLSHWQWSFTHFCSFIHETRWSILFCSLRWAWNLKMAHIIVIFHFKLLILWSRTVHLIRCAVLTHLNTIVFWLIWIPWLLWLITVAIISEHI